MTLLRKEVRLTSRLSVISTGLLTAAFILAYAFSSQSADIENQPILIVLFLGLSGVFMMIALFLSIAEVDTRGARKAITFPIGMINTVVKWVFFITVINIELPLTATLIITGTVLVITWLVSLAMLYHVKKTSDAALEKAFKGWYDEEKVNHKDAFIEENRLLKYGLYLAVGFIAFTQTTFAGLDIAAYVVLIPLTVLYFRTLYQRIYHREPKVLIYQIVLFNLMVILSVYFTLAGIVFDEFWNRALFHALMFSFVIVRYFKNNEVIEMANYDH